MRNIPLDVLLNFPAPNYENPTTRGSALSVVVIILTAITVIIVSLRVYTRVVVQRWSGWDDYFIALALVGTVGLSSLVLLALGHYGWDRHIWDIPLDTIQGAASVAFAAKILFIFTTTATRLSLLSFYYRLVNDAGKAQFRLTLHVATLFVVSFFLGSIFLTIFICLPVQAYWVFPLIANAKCIDEGRVGFVISIVNCLSDVVITALPLPLVLKLNMPLKSRLGVLLLFCLGFVVLVAAVVRTYYFWLSNVVSYDLTWQAYGLWIATAIEVNVGLICACAPALRVFIKRRFAPAVSNLGRSITGSLGNTGQSDTVVSPSTFLRGEHNRAHSQYSMYCQGRDEEQGDAVHELDKVRAEETKDKGRYSIRSSTASIPRPTVDHESSASLVTAPGTAI